MMANNIRMASKDEELNSYDMIIFSGMIVRVDPGKIKDDNDDFVLSIEVNGSQIDPEKIYSVVTNSYTASQAKKYFGDFGEQINPFDTNVIDRDALLDAVKQQKVINNVFETRLFLVKEK